jgi:segregation and condensation protein B
MSDTALLTALEAILFVSDRPVPLAELAKLLEADRGAVEAAVEALAAACHERGVRVQRLGEAVWMVSAPEVAAVVERFLGLESSQRLTRAALETLAIIAYRQPITRAGIEAIRGVSADYAVSALLARGLIAEVGRLDSVGHPALFATTFEFLQQIGLERLEDLPPLPAAAMEPAG